MTTQKKAGMTLAGFAAAAAVLFTAWGHIQPMLDWLAPILSRDSVNNVATAWLIAAFTLPLPWVLPKSMAPFWTGTVSAGVAFVVAAAAHATLSWPLSRTDVVHAIGLAGMGSIVWNLFITAVYLHLKPHAMPASLQNSTGGAAE